jgi:hypothetical protein
LCWGRNVAVVWTLFVTTRWIASKVGALSPSVAVRDKAGRSVEQISSVAQPTPEGVIRILVPSASPGSITDDVCGVL